jgi:hypothetical protein
VLGQRITDKTDARLASLCVSPVVYVTHLDLWDWARELAVQHLVS